MKKSNYKSFSVSITQDSELKSLRIEYAHLAPKKRRMAAQWEYESDMASDLFNCAISKIDTQTLLPKPQWPPGFLALAIDPRFAPAILTVGSLEYQGGFVKEAMELFLSLTKLPSSEKDLAEIIDKAGDFLLENDDYKNALELYLSAERANPTQALYYIGSGYCFSKLGNIEEALRKNRRAVEIEPDNYIYLNDLGYSLLEAGLFEEAETILKKSISLAPSDYELSRNNLKLLYKRKKTRSQITPSNELPPAAEFKSLGDFPIRRSATVSKIDLKKDLKHLYNSSAKEVVVVNVPLMNFLMIDGSGDPNTSQEYAEAIEALYALAYSLKFKVKKSALAIDYVVMPLEGLWWTDDPTQFSISNKAIWKWTAMIMQPQHITAELFREALAEVSKKKDLTALSRIRFESYYEGLSAQIMHVGAYAAEEPTIAKLRSFIETNGYKLNGKHHEIYLSDPRKTAPEKLKTILRQPIQKSEEEKK